MRIVSAHEGVIAISSSMSNAFIDFSTMDCSIVALVSDVVVDGQPVVGYGFNSNGRYSAGDILRRRILPRLMDAPADSLLDESGALSPSSGLGGDDAQREAGRPRRALGRGRRGRHGAARPGRQDRRGSVVPLDLRPLRRRPSRRVRLRLRGRRLLRTRQDRPGPAGRNARLPRRGVPRRQDEDRWRRPRRGPAPDRGGPGGTGRRRLPPRGRRQRAVRPRHRPGVRPRPRPLRAVLVRGGRRPARLPA